MGAVAFTLGGAVLGGVIGNVFGSALWGIFIGATVGSFIGGIVAPPEFDAGQLETPKPSDLQVITLGNNIPVPYLCGTRLIAPEIIAVIDKWTKPIKQKYEVSSGKGTKKKTQIVGYSYFVKILLGLCQQLNGDVVLGRFLINNKLYDPEQMEDISIYYELHKGSDEAPHEWLSKFDYQMSFRDLVYLSLEGKIGENISSLPNFQVELTRNIKLLDFSFWSLPLPYNDNQPNTFITLITSGVFCFNREEIWQQIDVYHDIWQPINSLSYNWQWFGNFTQDKNPESNTDFEKAIEEYEKYIGKDNITGFTFHVPWYWDTSDDSFEPMNAVLPADYEGDKVLHLFKKPKDGGKVYIENNTTKFNGSPLTDQLYYPTIAGTDIRYVKLMPKKNGTPIFGGTPDDDGLKQAIQYVIDKGYKFIFYSFCEVVDPPDLLKPWRGNLLPQHKSIEEFLDQIKEQCVWYVNYLVNNNLKPYAFITCSEMVSINKHKTYVSNPDDYTGQATLYQDDNGYFYFTAINKWIEIYDAVKQIFNDAGWNDVLVGYAADWSEVNGFKDEQGYWWRPLDDLFTHQDVVFIDAYYGITEHHTLKYEDYKEGWFKGRDWDYYITDYDKWKRFEGGTAPITDRAYAAKDLKYWLENYHYNYNPDGSVNSSTVWQPNAKKIFFTECGCGSIDSGATEPNLFYEPDAIQGGIPRGSTLTPNPLVQYYYYKALAENASEGSLPIMGFSIWQGDSRPLTTLLGCGRFFWADTYRVPYVHWIKYIAPLNTPIDVVLDLIVNDFTINRELNFAVDIGSLQACSEDLLQAGYLCNFYLDRVIKFEDLLIHFQNSYPMLFFVSDGLLQAKMLKREVNGCVYCLQDYDLDIYYDSEKNACYILLPLDHLIYDKYYRIENSKGDRYYISWWIYGAGTYKISASNIIKDSLNVVDAKPSNIKVTVDFYDTESFKTRSVTYELFVSPELNWQEYKVGMTSASSQDVALKQARYIAVLTLFKRNTITFKSYCYFKPADRIRVITNLKDSYYRITSVKLTEEGLYQYEGYEEPDSFHDILGQDISPVNIPSPPETEEPVLYKAFITNLPDSVGLSAFFSPDTASAMCILDYGNTYGKLAVETDVSAEQKSFSLEEETVRVNEELSEGYLVTENKELIRVVKGNYETYLLRGYKGSVIRESNEQLFQTDDVSEITIPFPEISAYLLASAIKGEKESSSIDLGSNIVYSIAGRVYKRKNKWVVTPVIVGKGAGTFGAGVPFYIDLDLLTIIVDDIEYNGVIEVELDNKPNKVEIVYNGKIWRW